MYGISGQKLAMNHSELLFLAKEAEIQHYFFLLQIHRVVGHPWEWIKRGYHIFGRNHFRQLPESHNQPHYALTL